jgi:hypothetical protein
MIMDAPLMADPSSQSTKPRNPNWGGRREGSGRKKHASTLTALPRAPVASHTTCMYYRNSSLFFFLIIISIDRYNTYTTPAGSGLLRSTQPLPGLYNVA